MSLVAYDASSDESEYEDNEETTAAASTTTVVKKVNGALINGQISDDDEDYLEHSVEDLKSTSSSLSLPKPIKETTIHDIIGKSPFAALPLPKAIHNQGHIEEDDEFLHKKDNFVSTETKPPKGPVKISVPSLKEFHDVHKEMTSNVKAVPKNTTKCSGLLSILPKAKSERNFAKTEGSTNEKIDDKNGKAPVHALIPDTVKYRRSAQNTEGVNDDTGAKRITVPQKKKSNAVSGNGDDMSDDENNATQSGLDFFSLTADDDCLPDVSASEINMMVANKAAKIAQATTKYLRETESKALSEAESEQSSNQKELELARKRYQDSQLGEEATQALVGSSAKRRRNQNETINIMDLNSDQILPNRDEWMRTALASSTTYQPTGVLVDEEPAAGTRRKHQITYLAHKAKANEAELQAIWAANRQTRRATQSKYGF